MAPIWQWSAVETAQAIRSGRASAVEVVAAHQARLRAANPAVNAVVVDLSDVALRQAEQAEGARGVQSQCSGGTNHRQQGAIREPYASVI